MDIAPHGHFLHRLIGFYPYTWRAQLAPVKIGESFAKTVDQNSSPISLLFSYFVKFTPSTTLPLCFTGQFTPLTTLFLLFLRPPIFRIYTFNKTSSLVAQNGRKNLTQKLGEKSCAQFRF